MGMEPPNNGVHLTVEVRRVPIPNLPQEGSHDILMDILEHIKEGVAQKQ